MSLLGSLGTKRGMRLYYIYIPLCKFCKKIKCVRYPQRDLKCCSKCYYKLTNEKLNQTQPTKEETYFTYIKRLKDKIKKATQQNIII